MEFGSTHDRHIVFSKATVLEFFGTLLLKASIKT